MSHLLKPLNYLFIFMVFFHIPLSAMDEDSEQIRTPSYPLKFELSNVAKKVAFGGFLIYTGAYTDYVTPAEQKHLTSSPQRLVGVSTAILGVTIVMSGVYDFASCLYKNWRQKSINSQIDALRPSKKIISEKKEKRIALLSNVNLEEEVNRSFNYFKYGTDVLQGCFWIPQILNHIDKFNRPGIKILVQGEEFKMFTLLPDFNDPVGGFHVSILTLGAGLGSLVHSAKNLIKLKKGQMPDQDSPLQDFARAASNMMTAKIFGIMLTLKLMYLFEEERKNPASEPFATKEFLSNYETFLAALQYYSFAQIGYGIMHFAQGCKKVYDERQYWFNLVDELAAVKSNTTVDLTEANHTTPVRKQRKTFEPDPYSQTESNSLFLPPEPSASQEPRKEEELPPPPKKPKTKRTGTAKPPSDKKPGKNKSQVPDPAAPSYPSQDASERENALSLIKEMRERNSVNRNSIKSQYKKAATFVNGKIQKHGNKVTINWRRGEKQRSVNFELAHKQANEKASVFKGKKLTKVLDALEQTYLDGWDEAHIRAHLKGRFKLYNLPYEYLKVLWTSQDVN